MAFEHPTEAFQLRRIQFVPAQRPDVTPVPTGVDIIVLNGTLPVRSVNIVHILKSFCADPQAITQLSVCRKLKTPA